jgi:Chromo (CHRromatin Organisation MOdifier) domain
MRIHDVFHVSLLKPYHPDSRVKAPPPPLHIGGNLEYEVETILNHRDRRRGRSTRREFLVKWVGYQPEHNTWEPEKHLVHSPDILAKYWNTRATQEAAPASNQRSSRGRSRR